MAGTPEKPEDLVLKPREVEVLQAQGKPVSEAARRPSFGRVFSCRANRKVFMRRGTAQRFSLKH
jgi:hypothetical protein